MKALKKILLIFILSLLTCLNGLPSFADIKLNNVSFDSSNAFMFLSTSNTGIEAPAVNATTLKNPNRVFYDINNAILTRPNESWYFRGSDINQIRVSQFSTNPNIVRVVFYHNANFNPKNISVINVKGNYLFKFGNIELGQSNYAKAYRSVHAEDSDYLEKMVYIPQSEMEKTQPQQTSSEITLQNVQKAFAGVSKTATKPTSSNKSEIATPYNFSWDKIFKLRTNYFLSRVDIKKGNILLLGSGRITVEKPIYLTNPTRVVFDLPNTMVTKRFKNVEIQLSDSETLRVGQFEPSKVRLVITTQTPEAYRTIYSSDGQGVLIGNDSRLSGINLYENNAQIMKMATKAENSMTDIFAASFSSPIVYSVKELNSKFELVIHNAIGFNEEAFKQALSQSKLTAKAYAIQSGGIKIDFTLKNNAEVELYTKEDGTQLQVRIKNKKQLAPITTTNQNDNSEYCGCGLIMIDPGHGGVDGGAVRAGINEKDINLEVSKMIAQILKKKGYAVDLTRWDDATLSLQDRVDYSDANKASIFVSIHVNSSVSSDPNGIETHWWTEDGEKLAEVVHSEFTKKVKAEDRGLVKSKFYVINHTKAKSILVEIGFISNDNERKELMTQSRKQKTAEGIAEGIIKFIKKEGVK